MTYHTHQVVPPCHGSRTELLRTSECLPIGAELTARENDYFGSDFEWGLDNVSRWARSGCMFYASVIQTGLDTKRRVLGLASVLVAGAESCNRLLAGLIHEQELVPWLEEGLDSTPRLYFSSVLSDRPEYLPSLYASLLNDVEEYLRAHQLKVFSGLSIAVGPAGFQHMSKNGFTAVAGPCYLHRYRFMRIDAGLAKTEFWRRLLTVQPGPEVPQNGGAGQSLSETLGSALSMLKPAAA